MSISCVPQASKLLNFQPAGINKESHKHMVSQLEKKEEIDRAAMYPLNEPINKYSARLIRKQMLAGKRRLSKSDRLYLKHMIDYGRLMDRESLHIFLNLLLAGPQEF